MKAKRFFSLILCALLALTLTTMTAPAAGEGIPAQTDGPAFSDLSATNVLYPYVRYLTDQGVMGGFPDGTFRPEAALTRAEAAKIAVLAKGLSPVSGGAQSFNDVPVGHWAYSCIEKAAGAGLIKGYPGGTFKPDELITRPEAAALLLRLSGGALSDNSLAIADVSPGNWAYKPVDTAVEAGIMGLSSDGLFVPDAAFTRGELAQSLSTLFTLGPALREVELIGKLTVTTGKIKIIGQDGSSRLLSQDQETTVTAGMTIATDPGSRAEISYDDGSGIRLEPNTQISVVRSDGFRYMRPDGTPAVAVDKLEIKMSGGRIFGALANRNEGMDEDYVTPAAEGDLPWWLYPYSARERIRVDMPSSVTGVWGSFWSVLQYWGGPDSTEVLEGAAADPGSSRSGFGGSETAVLSGHVEVTSGGQTISLGGGGGMAPPSPPAPLSPGQGQLLQSAEDWFLNRAQEIQTSAPTPPPPQQPGGVPATSPPSPPLLGQQQPNVVNVIQTALGQAGSAGSVSGGDSGGDSSSEAPSYTPPAITGPDTINLTAGYANYQQTYTLSGYPAPTLTITENSAGATLDGGTLTISAGLGAGSYSVTLAATNSTGTTTKTVTVNVSPAAPMETAPTINGRNAISLMQGDSLSEPYTFGGSPPPTQFGIDWGDGEEWDAVSFSGGTLTVSPELPAGEYTFTLTATNTAGTGTLPVTMTVNPVTITLSPATLPDALFNVAYPAATLTTSGGTGPYEFEVSAGSLPGGLELYTATDTTGIISGTYGSGDGGDYTFTVTATDISGNTGTGEYVIHTYAQISPSYTFFRWDGTVEGSPAARLTAVGGAGEPYTFAISAEDAAVLQTYGATLELQPNGDITGTVTEDTGEDGVDVNVTVTDAHGNTMTVPVTMHLYNH